MTLRYASLFQLSAGAGITFAPSAAARLSIAGGTLGGLMLAHLLLGGQRK